MGMFECSAVGCSDEVPGEGNGLTVVVEYETDLEGGAYEVGVAPEGSGRPGSSVSSQRRAARPMPWWGMRADGPPSASGAATWKASTARAAGPCTSPEGSELHQQGVGAPMARPRRFSGDVSRHPRTPARQGAAAPWNLA